MTEYRKGRWFKPWGLLFGVTLVLSWLIGVWPASLAAVEGALPPIESTLPTSCTSPTSSPHHYKLVASPETVHWGFYSKNLDPLVTVNSQDYVTLETITHHAGDDYERMAAGDPAIESIYHWTADEKTVSDRGPGVHILTGPVYVCGAEPGDLLEVRVIDLKPRPSGNPLYAGKAFGSNAAAWWGFQYDNLKEDPKPREVITIYEMDATGAENWAEAVYRYQWTPQTTPDGTLHETIDYPGIIVDPATVTQIDETLDGVKIPLRLHMGSMGVAPSEADIVDSIPPSYFGGNIDNRNIGIGTTMYYPVAVPGALFSAGDAHASQGDGELDGTAIETSMDGIFQFVLHKQADLAGTILEGVNYPLLETAEAWIVHGFTYPNYLEALGDEAQSRIYELSSLDPALKDSSAKMRDFLMNGMTMSEDEAFSLMTVGADFAITQVVDGNWGVHGIIPKGIFAAENVKPKPSAD
ncbi:acetamidase/formamidase family protein [Nodosilinea sp. P-1105]|uniref:acetamidase/formamidase family protein n=1 Tax=Nodosilinea sp. P-1105 TaxID=2546229 RepID=UPI00146CAD63|nr:acetamidase/formamidase family protein [Nodosilinea sp. P-1105]NMF82217.1 acetamidase [Nodosilinea sp. P-1105]